VSPCNRLRQPGWPRTKQRGAYGLHLVRVLARTEPRLPEFAELRDRLSNDYSFETRRAANALERLTERFQIVFEGSWQPPQVEVATTNTR
jgi:hypothetical protein